MLNNEKLKKYRKRAEQSVSDLAQVGVRAGWDAKQSASAIRNWEKGLLKPQPTMSDVDSLAKALGIERQDLLVWKATHKFAPIAPRKARLVADLIRGRYAQEALDVLDFANKRAAVMIKKVLESAIANADEQEADVSRLFVSEARVDEGGIRQGTRRWRPKDRGRAVSWTRLASHINVTVDTE
jgi:large subunit ribosomal protein L22